VTDPPARTQRAARLEGGALVASVVERPAGTLYRGREGMWSWVAHRVTGFAIFMFLLVHVLDTALVRVSPEAYNEVIATYKNPIMGVGEAGLVAAILFHAFNGLRVIAVDFWSQGPRFQRQLLWAVGVVWVLLFVPFAIRHLSHVFGG
jgi:succinate dehydrogenase / fumarate reductase cytochrome b subunit